MWTFFFRIAPRITQPFNGRPQGGVYIRQPTLVQEGDETVPVLLCPESWPTPDLSFLTY